jgi:hypothetical protein
VNARLRHEMFSPPQTLGSLVRMPLEAWLSVFNLSLLFCVCRGLAMADPQSKDFSKGNNRKRTNSIYLFMYLSSFLMVLG